MLTALFTDSDLLQLLQVISHKDVVPANFDDRYSNMTHNDLMCAYTYTQKKSPQGEEYIKMFCSLWVLGVGKTISCKIDNGPFLLVYRQFIIL